MLRLFKRPQPPQFAEAAPVGVTREDIIASVEMILGRSPDQGLIDHHLAMGFKNRFELGRYMISTGEFRDQHKALTRQPLFMGDRILAHTHRNQPIFLIPNDIDITPSILLYGSWETQVERVVRGSIDPGDVAIDIGSNVGVHTVAMADKMGPGGRLHAFEANPAVMALLKATMMVNQLTDFGGAGRVTLHACAASDQAGSLILEQAPGHFGSGHLVTNRPGADFGEAYSVRVEVPTVAIDELLGDTIGTLDFLHMDIEGAEPLAIRGARALVSRSPGLRIVTEWSVGMMNAMADVQDYIDWLAGEGFRFWRIGGEAGVETVAVSDLLGLPHCDLFVSRQDPPVF
jgi:FkbM family methyltransferase